MAVGANEAVVSVGEVDDGALAQSAVSDQVGQYTKPRVVALRGCRRRNELMGNCDVVVSAELADSDPPSISEHAMVGGAAQLDSVRENEPHCLAFPVAHPVRDRSHGRPKLVVDP